MRPRDRGAPPREPLPPHLRFEPGHVENFVQPDEVVGMSEAAILALAVKRATAERRAFEEAAGAWRAAAGRVSVARHRPDMTGLVPDPAIKESRRFKLCGAWLVWRDREAFLAASGMLR